jgi:two-component sensor histidine kinase
MLALRDQEPVVYAVELRKSEEDEFAALTERLRDLNNEVVARRSAQAQAEEALAHNGILYRELQHRVKNQLQMLLALVSVAGRESADPSQKLFVQTLQSKISALFDAQRLMYADRGAAGVQADQMLNSIADTVQSLNGSGVSVAVTADAVRVANDTAFPLALIANELLTNAVKYGCPSSSSRVHVNLTRRVGSAVLEITDEGPGFEPSKGSRASSGIGLVRGLCRQIGARLDIRSVGGTSVLVTFPLSETSHAAS